MCTACNISNENYFYDNNVCMEKCGKGFRLSSIIQCDDGNLINGDGCNSDCKIEKDWKCKGGNDK